MVRKRKKNKEEEVKPWCYYCDREFNDENTLIMHQKAKHYKCSVCNKKLHSAQGMAIHSMQVHKLTITAVPNAKPGRDSMDKEIFGMAGVPPGMQPGDPLPEGDDEPEAKAAKVEEPQPPPAMGLPGAARLMYPSPQGFPPMGYPPGFPGQPPPGYAPHPVGMPPPQYPGMPGPSGMLPSGGVPPPMRPAPSTSAAPAVPPGSIQPGTSAPAGTMPPSGVPMPHYPGHLPPGQMYPQGQAPPGGYRPHPGYGAAPPGMPPPGMPPPGFMPGMMPPRPLFPISDGSQPAQHQQQPLQQQPQPHQHPQYPQQTPGLGPGPAAPLFPIQGAAPQQAQSAALAPTPAAAASAAGSAPTLAPPPGAGVQLVWQLDDISMEEERSLLPQYQKTLESH